MKYFFSDDQGDILPNILGLIIEKDINEAEFEGFLKAEFILPNVLQAEHASKVAIFLKFIKWHYVIYIHLQAN